MKLLIAFLAAGLLLGPGSAVAAGKQQDGTAPPGYTCKSDTVDGPVCECDSYWDCERMEKDGVCNEDQPFSCDAGTFDCSCAWIQGAPPPKLKLPKLEGGKAPSEEGR